MEIWGVEPKWFLLSGSLIVWHHQKSTVDAREDLFDIWHWKEVGGCSVSVLVHLLQACTAQCALHCSVGVQLQCGCAQQVGGALCTVCSAPFTNVIAHRALHSSWRCTVQCGCAGTLCTALQVNGALCTLQWAVCSCGVQLHFSSFTTWWNSYGPKCTELCTIELSAVQFSEVLRMAGHPNAEVWQCSGKKCN